MTATTYYDLGYRDGYRRILRELPETATCGECADYLDGMTAGEQDRGADVYGSVRRPAMSRGRAAARLARDAEISVSAAADVLAVFAE